MKAITAKQPKPVKLTTMEKRAAAMCAEIKSWLTRPGEVYPVAVEWARSRMMGHCPRIEYRREKVAHASGCGYCKLSTVLADALCHLAETEDARQRVASAGGAGENTVRERLREIGWDLVSTASGPDFDNYHITRIA